MKTLKAHQFLLSSAKPTSFILSKPFRILRLSTPLACRACRTDQISAPSKVSSHNGSSSSSLVASGNGSRGFRRRGWVPETMEETVEKARVPIFGTMIGDALREPQLFLWGQDGFSIRNMSQEKSPNCLAIASLPFERNSWETYGLADPLLPCVLRPYFCDNAFYQCRFLTLFGVLGSLVGSVLCFFKGCNFVAASFGEHVVRSGKVMTFLVEAIDVYLLGTVMLVFGMGLYELFVSNIDIEGPVNGQKFPYRSNLFGLFTLMERPKWLEIKSVNELKTKVGHVIVMLLLIGFFDHSLKVATHTPTDLLCFSASILLCSLCLYLLAKLNGSRQQ